VSQVISRTAVSVPLSTVETTVSQVISHTAVSVPLSTAETTVSQVISHTYRCICPTEYSRDNCESGNFTYLPLYLSREVQRRQL